MKFSQEMKTPLNIIRRKVFGILRQTIGNDCLEIFTPEKKQVISSLLDLSDYLDLTYDYLLSLEGRYLGDENISSQDLHKKLLNYHSENHREDDQ